MKKIFKDPIFIVGVVLVIFMGMLANKAFAFGTGVAISEDTVLTNRHVVGDNKYMYYSEIVDHKVRIIKGEVIKHGREGVTDAAVIKLSGKVNACVHLIKHNTRPTLVQAVMFDMASPQMGWERYYYPMKITERFMNDNIDSYRMLPPTVRPGNSGSPIFNNEGQVVGLVYMYEYSMRTKEALSGVGLIMDQSYPLVQNVKCKKPTKDLKSVVGYVFEESEMSFMLGNK